ncbi:MAG TPA: hypothetical protein VIM64_16625, partial [Puia sp.]
EVWRTELDNEDYVKYDLPFFSQKDFTAPFASGSGKYDTMIIVPCSMGTLDASPPACPPTSLQGPPTSSLKKEEN